MGLIRTMALQIIAVISVVADDNRRSYLVKPQVIPANSNNCNRGTRGYNSKILEDIYCKGNDPGSTQVQRSGASELLRKESLTLAPRTADS